MPANRPQSIHPKARPRGLAWIVGCWSVAVIMGTSLLWRYAMTPGVPMSQAAAVPVESLIPLEPGRATVVMVVHPGCACSRASLNDLETLIAQLNGAIKPVVVFAEPAEWTVPLEASDLWQSAGQIPGVTRVRDQQGLIARELGANTSGQTYLYDAQGQLQFSGGVTDARGHAGDSTGADAIEAIVAGRAPTTRSTAVFGCSLR